MPAQRQIYLNRFLLFAGTGLLILPLILYGRLHFLRPPQIDKEQPLFQGIFYRRVVRSTPRPLMIHIVSVDLKTPGVKVLVTPGMPTPDDTEINARTTSEFLNEFKLQLAINGSFFYLFREQTPWDYYPHSGDRVNVVGQAIANGRIYSKFESKWPVVCFSSSNIAQIFDSGSCPKDTFAAVAGSEVLVAGGNGVSKNFNGNNNKPYPRVVVATNKKGDKLWLIAVDGKQPLYSEGVTMAELTKIVMELGAYAALNLDGGGSTTLVMATPSGASLLNAPIQTKLPMRERPVANHLGFYALPLQR
ncbi:phosphodiester glycosidase family protein [Funiculus sociatus GB2-A5]|uniref:Phosphodiester glycosidase family protein n=1 Tax=Funiculus sociatus GB2-A5 TaxID=2933946 RepID=A0ABV0JPT3_9CYAN|nr:phosphodiester glycosidase family protein [Trichocoleus sp. FACHB-6]MBD2063915.1 phosphodiester glycosidase family protein [Trichocoleus sp. FACHB-6]